MHKTIFVTFAAGMAAAFISFNSANAASIWTIAGGGSWSTAANWNPAVVPNAVGDNATFNNAASGANAAQTANRTITLDGAKTIGSLNLNADAANAFTNTISTGTGGPLTFDETGSGPATIVTNGPGTGNHTISVAMVLNDDVVATVNQQNTASSALSLNLTGAMSGAGGFTKNGDGGATFGTGAKTYTGATVLNGGRLRSSTTAQPSATSSFTINAGGQLDPISNGTYTLGTGPLNLNGAGPTTGQFAPFPGAIRPDTGLVLTFANAVVLQSNTVIHSQSAAGVGSITFSGAVSGPGKLIAGATPHDANIGSIILSNAVGNSYSGGSEVVAGILQATATSVNAFGTGDVTVDSGNATFATSSAKLSILAGATNSIADAATLFLTGGSTAGVADDGYADLGAGINDTIGGLWLGGVQQFAPGTYGSTASGATFQNNEYFAGTGVVTLLPEPSSLGLVGLALVGLICRRHKS
jgi:autotransporter-associated beta strand protein